jgi:hypothetical protein
MLHALFRIVLSVMRKDYQVEIINSENKKPEHDISMKRVYIYKGFERFWHWTQALLIIFLAFTGFEVHGSIHILGFEHAARFHRMASLMLIGLIVFAIFWHLVTGEWKQYIPTSKNLAAQIGFTALECSKEKNILPVKRR